MNRNDQDYIISKIRTAYTPKQKGGLDELRRPDAHKNESHTFCKHCAFLGKY